jgi:1-acyl-sn-glycerol-3-phosphate acyltransferase
MSPLAFLSRPERWLQAIHRHRGTLTAAPNFAYELCARKVPDEALEGLDLSSWRMTLNGAEPISPGTMARFAERFARCGFRPTAMTPTYGLAECSLALAMTPVARAPLVDRVDRAAFTWRGRAVPAAPDCAEVLEFVSCGAPLVGHEIRVVDEAGRELAERREGRLEFRGPSATAGYFRNPEATARLVRGDGWLDSGDRAYMAGGEVYLTGRAKDLIIRAGRNLYPHELEAAVGALPGVRKGCVAVFGARVERDGTEALVVLAETREREPATRAALEQQIRALAVELLDEPAIEVALAPAHTVLKTSSGKIRRAACRDLWEQGKIGQTPRAAWLQLARLGAEGWVLTARNHLASVGEALYAARFWAAVGAGAGAMALPVVALPRRRMRWAVARGAARASLALAGVRPTIAGADRLRGEGPVVFVANHASYADNLVTTAVLAGDVAVAGKRELAAQWPTGLLLERLGVVFVERFEHAEGARGVDQLVAVLAAGRSLLVYPEGTCARMPGLLPFRMGAFVAAAQAGVPVVPVTIRGTRNLLRPTTWRPRRTALEVEVGAPLRARGSDWGATVELRDRARAVILAACGEPDLAGEDALARLAAGRGGEMGGETR